MVMVDVAVMMNTTAHGDVRRWVLSHRSQVWYNILLDHLQPMCTLFGILQWCVVLRVTVNFIFINCLIQSGATCMWNTTTHFPSLKQKAAFLRLVLADFSRNIADFCQVVPLYVIFFMNLDLTAVFRTKRRWSVQTLRELVQALTRSTGTMHTSDKARLTSVAISVPKFRVSQ